SSGGRTLLGEQPAEAFAGRAREDDVRSLAPERLPHVIHAGLAPARRRLLAVERKELLPVHEVEHGPTRAREPLEGAHRPRVHVDTADAPKLGLEVADARLSGVEALRAAADAGKEVRDADLDPTRGEDEEASCRAMRRRRSAIN